MKDKFSISKKIKSFGHAIRGVCVFIKSNPHNWVIILALVVVPAAGFYFNITEPEWLAVIIVIGFVFAAEAFNTAIEVHMNLTSPEHHPFARDTKDVAAGASLIAVITAAVVGVMVFGPHLVSAFGGF